jgi:antitoxin ParD1/3/4
MNESGVDHYTAGAAASGSAQAKTLRERARAGGLCFEAYLPPYMADWLLDQVERGVFTDPSEAVFVMLREQHELEPHDDLREELLRRSCQAAMDDPRRPISHEEGVQRVREPLASPPPKPAVRRRTW